ncbi:type 2C protein phosphatase PTC1 [Aspergillus tanneri]|uniref:Protein phosphatase 2C 1 n=1 Tax=Aspergillus tanneri TaxID=1220188 RepID=A0A5M9N301_9EURO|nr:Protein phosphatase 2C 1 [Aspergillus tanneri]KAA8652696.1 Protein phosphatase 2C 1 [Aspergillus tanneri]
MFSGSSSPPKERLDTIPHSSAIDTPSKGVVTEEASVSQKKFSPPGGFFTRRTSEDQGPTAEKRRRSSTVTKAATFFTNAKNSLSLSSSPREGSFNNHTVHSSPALQSAGNMDPALSVPQGSFNNSAGESLPTPHSSFRVGVTEDRNRKCRRTMEDTHAYLYNFLGSPLVSSPAKTGNKYAGDVSPTTEEATSVVETDNGYFAIFDGHAGTFAAEWCGKKLHLILEETMRKSPKTPVPELLDQTFTAADQQLEKLPVKNSGCTAVIALLRWEDKVSGSYPATNSTAKSDTILEAGDTPTQSATTGALPVFPKPQDNTKRHRILYTANVGDARAILSRNGRALRLSYDHKGSDENEGKRIANAGGLILNNRVNGVLAVTRALGDAYLKDLVTGHPYTTETVIQPDLDEFIILACDGLWDVCSDQEAVDLVRNVPDAQEASKILVDHALSRFSTDNLSCMVIRFDSELVKNIATRTIGPTGVDGDSAMNIEQGVSEAEKIVEGARKSMANAGISDDPETAERVKEEILQKMSGDEPEPELSVNELSEAPLVSQTNVSSASNTSKSS